MTTRQNGIRHSAAKIVTDENLDLYVLAAGSLTFTVLGFLGITTVTILASVILALLAMLALSQIRSRQHVAAIATMQRADPLALFQVAMPTELASTRSTATSFLYIGESMVRTAQNGRADLRRMLSDAGKVRVLILDPDNESLLRAADRLRDNMAGGRIRNTLAELTALHKNVGGQLEVRTSSFVPRIGVYGFNLGEADAALFIQHYEHRPRHDSAPIFRLDVKDGFWFEYFAAEATRMWDDGTRWSPASP
jgi:hypothetical protein